MRYCREIAIFSILMFFISIDSSAKKMNYPLEVVVGLSDLIVTGEITRVRANSYDFEVSETVKGTMSKNITVSFFKEWTCDRRRYKPEIGQKLFLFLKNKVFKYEIINGSTGEMFIVGDSVKRRINREYYKTEELINSIQLFTSCYRLANKFFKPFENPVFIRLKTDQEIETLSKNTNLTKWFFDRVKKYEVVE